LAIAVTVGFVPSAFLATAAARLNAPVLASAGLALLLVVPAAYFYSAYRRHFTNYDLRANRALSIYLFLLLMGIVAPLLIAWTLSLTDFPGDEVVVAGAFVLGAAILAMLVFPAFQRLVETYLLLMPLAPEGLAHTYSARITTSLSASGLARLLTDEVLPSLLVRQSALLVRYEAGWRIFYTMGVDRQMLPTDSAAISSLQAHAGRYQGLGDSSGAIQSVDWVRLGLMLHVGDKVVGCWLFGQRDPDDYYSPSEVAMLKALANQTAIAIVNIEQAERLRSLYEANIDRHERERAELASTIHDEILRNLAILNNSVAPEAVTTEYEKAYSRVDVNLRRMTSRLRPVMLDVSLYSALEEMADELNERLIDKGVVLFDIPASSAIYPAQVKEYLFRIVQNACENALRHAEASCIEISGKLVPDHAVIAVCDDGIGMAEAVNLSDLAHRKRFGLVGMHERAEIIGAHLSIGSKHGQGTTITVEWMAPSEQDDTRPST
jgi:signal transduction histidine kinase